MDPHPRGTLVFSTIGRPNYGFDVFSLNLNSSEEHRLTDGRSINFNAQFTDNHDSIVFISERTGSPAIFLNRPGSPTHELLLSVPGSLFHDRPLIKNNILYFISAHQNPNQFFKSWSALYSTDLDRNITTRLTPPGSVDYSPAVSLSGELVAVASYGEKPWAGEFHELNTHIVVFRASQSENRAVICERGGWPTWSGDSVVYFHRRDDAGWWGIFRVDLSSGIESTTFPVTRVTPEGIHCFTPAAFHDGKRVALATRRGDTKFRHVEIFDIETESFVPVTSTVNPSFHHYNPFVSSDSEFVGYHRFRGESSTQWGGESIIPHLEPVNSPISHLTMLRFHGNFPTFSPDADLVAFNPDLTGETGVKIVKSDGSKCWTLLEDRTCFNNSWSPTKAHVIFTSVGPIFQSASQTVQIARIEFNPSDLNGENVIQCSVKILTREDTGNNAFASCSPDGKSLVFRSGRTGHKNLYILDAVNGEFNGGIQRLTEGSCIDTMPSWSPRGDLIAFSSNRHKPDDAAVFSIYVIKPDGSGMRRIHVADGDDVDRERINHVCFSRDGEWLLFTANLGGVTAEPVSFPNQFQPYGDLYMVRLDGSGLRRLTWNGYENGTPTWHTSDDVDLGSLRVGSLCEVGDKLRGQFDEPVWISCNI